MKSIEGILGLVEQEFQAVVSNGRFRSREEIDSVYKMMDIVKDAYCIWQYEEEAEGGYSEEGGSNRGSYRGSYRGSNRGGSYEGSYDGGMSGARGRGRGARRDSMGRYSREGGSYRGGSYRSNNYSREEGKQEYIEELRELMESAPDDQTRQSIQRMIQQMEQG